MPRAGGCRVRPRDSPRGQRPPAGPSPRPNWGPPTCSQRSGGRSRRHGAGVPIGRDRFRPRRESADRPSGRERRAWRGTQECRRRRVLWQTPPPGIPLCRVVLRVRYPGDDRFLWQAGAVCQGAAGAAEFLRTPQRGGHAAALTRAIGELRRIAKSLYLLAYLDDEAYLRRVLTQLNRGEVRHSLARAVFHGQKGELRQRYREGQEDQLGARPRRQPAGSVDDALHGPGGGAPAARGRRRARRGRGALIAPGLRPCEPAGPLPLRLVRKRSPRAASGPCAIDRNATTLWGRTSCS